MKLMTDNIVVSFIASEHVRSYLPNAAVHRNPAIISPRCMKHTEMHVPAVVAHLGQPPQPIVQSHTRRDKGNKKCHSQGHTDGHVEIWSHYFYVHTTGRVAEVARVDLESVIPIRFLFTFSSVS